MADIKWEGGDGVNGFLEGGLLREGSKEKSQRCALLPKRWKHGDKTSVWLLVHPEHILAFRFLTFGAVWWDNCHQNSAVINSIFWGRVKLEHCDIYIRQNDSI